MGKIAKVIIPLLNLNIKLEDISEDTQFIGAYTSDINRPYLTHHIFLMYKWENPTQSELRTFYKFRDFKNLYSWKIVYINKIPYLLYTFTYDNLLDCLIEGILSMSDNFKRRILEFWSFKDPWIYENIMRDTIYVNPDNESVPEIDYAPPFTLRDEKKGGLQIIL
jgi:hypothetical protein